MMKARKTLILSSSYIDIMLGDPNCWSFFHFFFWGVAKANERSGSVHNAKGSWGLSA